MEIVLTHIRLLFIEQLNEAFLKKMFHDHLSTSPQQTRQKTHGTGTKMTSAIAQLTNRILNN